MTTGYGIPHGHAVALTIGPFLEFNARVEDADCNHHRGAAHVRATMDALLGLIGARSAADAHAQWITRMEALGLPSRLERAGVPHDEVEALASGVNLERAGNNPRRIDTDAACKLLNAAA
jgi:alcohol dehydrogenase class IV